MALHEIGYLIIGGVFQCYLWSVPENPCANSEKIKPAGITREKSGEFETREIDSETRGFVIYDKKGDSLEIRKRTGEKVRLQLAELNNQTRKALPKTVPSEEVDLSLWRFQPLEEILSSSMLAYEPDLLPQLRKDDLKTPVVIAKEQLEDIRQARINEALKNAQVNLPIAYILTSVPCAYQKANGTSMSGTCSSPGTVAAYSKPDRNSEKILQATWHWAHFEGRPILSQKPMAATQSDELLIFEEQGEWLRMKLVVLDKSKRVVWVNKKDIPYKIVKLEPKERMKTLLEFLQQNTSEENRYLAENLKKILENPVELSLEAAGESKWVDGILWMQVNVKSNAECVSEDGKVLATGWLPYIDPKSKKQVLSWVSRGC